MSKSADSYIAAAMAVADAPAPEPEAPAVDPNAPVLTAGGEPPTVEPEPDAELDAAAAELAAEEPEEAPAEEAPPAPKPPEKKPEPKPEAKEAAKNPRLEKSYEDLARRESALRKEQEALKADAADIERGKRLAAAAKSRDALALLKEAEIPWSEAAQQVLEGSAKRAAKADDDDEEPEENPRLSAIEQELYNLKAQKAEAEFRSNLAAKVSETPEKYKLVVKRKAEGEVMRFIEDFYKQTKRLPGETLDETMEIALEAVELRLTKERDSWKELLTDDDGVVTSSSSKTAVPAGAASKQAPKTLTNNTGSGPTSLKNGGTPKAKSDEDYIAAAIAAAGNA